MVQVQKQIGFTNFVMPNDPELVREAFAGELDGTTLQSDIKSFGECRHKYLRQPAFSCVAVAGCQAIHNATLLSTCTM
jgi:hypothetical protein